MATLSKNIKTWYIYIQLGLISSYLYRFYELFLHNLALCKNCGNVDEAVKSRKIFFFNFKLII